MSGRRSFLGFATMTMMAFAVLFFGGGLLRSCAPDAATLAAERGTFLAVPDEGLAYFVADGHLAVVRRFTPEEKAVLAELPATPVPYLNRDGVEAGTVPATVETVLQGPDNDILVLFLVGDSPYSGFQMSNHIGDGSHVIFEHRMAVLYDALGRVEGPHHASYGNLFSPTITVVEGEFYIPGRALETGLP